MFCIDCRETQNLLHYYNPVGKHFFSIRGDPSILREPFVYRYRNERWCWKGEGVRGGGGSRQRGGWGARPQAESRRPSLLKVGLYIDYRLYFTFYSYEN